MVWLGRRHGYSPPTRNPDREKIESDRDSLRPMKQQPNLYSSQFVLP
jgi:hypothetical protein